MAPLIQFQNNHPHWTEFIIGVSVAVAATALVGFVVWLFKWLRQATSLRIGAGWTWARATDPGMRDGAPERQRCVADRMRRGRSCTQSGSEARRTSTNREQFTEKSTLPIQCQLKSARLVATFSVLSDQPSHARRLKSQRSCIAPSGFKPPTTRGTKHRVWATLRNWPNGLDLD